MLELRRRVGRGEARWYNLMIEIHRLLPVRFSIRGHRSYRVCACGHVRCGPWALPTAAQSTRRHADTEFGADAEPPNTHKQKQVSKVLVFTHLSSHSSVNPPAMSTKDSKKRLHQAREATDGSVGVRGRAAPGRRTTKQTERSTHRGREMQRQKCSGPISGAAPGISMAPGSGSRRAGSPRISGTTVPMHVHAL